MNDLMETNPTGSKDASESPSESEASGVVNVP